MLGGWGASRFFYVADTDVPSGLLCASCLAIMEICFAAIAGETSSLGGPPLGSVRVSVREPESPATEGKQDGSTSSVRAAGRRSATSPATAAPTVPRDALANEPRKNARPAPSAGFPYDSCGTPIAADDAGGLRSRVDTLSQRASAIYTGARPSPTPIHDLALSAEHRGSIATIRITASRKKSSGFAIRATVECMARAEGPASSTVSATRFLYSAKSSTAEREAGLDGLPLRRRVDSEPRATRGFRLSELKSTPTMSKSRGVDLAANEIPSDITLVLSQVNSGAGSRASSGARPGAIRQAIPWSSFGVRPISRSEMSYRPGP